MKKVKEGENPDFFECPECFIRWENEARKHIVPMEYSKCMKCCDFCEINKSNYDWHIDGRIERMIDVMPHACSSNFPTTMKLLWEYIKKEYD